MKHILIVEDDHECAFLLQLQLNRLQYLSSVCCDVFQILEKIKRKTIDILIVDINLLGYQSNGIDVIRQVRKLDSELKIVVITAISTGDMRQESFKAGASYFITKPYSINDLKTVLNN